MIYECVAYRVEHKNQSCAEVVSSLSNQLGYVCAYSRVSTNIVFTFHTPDLPNSLILSKWYKCYMKFIPQQTKQNPADEASRGLSTDNFLKCERWIKGPTFLLDDAKDWPKPDEDKFPTSLDDPEVTQDIIGNAWVARDVSNAINKLLSYFSDWEKMKTSVARFLKFKYILQELRRQTKSTQGQSYKKKMQQNIVKQTNQSERCNR